MIRIFTLMSSTIDTHKVFADYFGTDIINPIAYACSKKLSEGHICLDLDEYNLENSKPLLAKDLIKSKWVTNIENETNAFVLENNKVYLHRYFSYESEIINAIRQLIEKENIDQKAKLLLDKTTLIRKVFGENKKDVNWQLVAALMSYLHNFSIITGGPGTGKTTTIAKLLSIVYSINPQTKVALTAPTGKAAARIKESILQAKSQITGLDDTTKLLFDNIGSSTIHRLLGYKRGTHYFKHNAQNLLNYDIVIVDESSMIGVSLMAKLISAIAPDKQIIFLGDKDQLASVEAGSVFGDICQSQSEINHFGQESLNFLNRFSDYQFSKNDLITKENSLSEHIIELQKSYRFDKNKGIGQISDAVLNGKLDHKEINNFEKDNEVRVFTDYKSKDFEAFYELYQTYISEQDTLNAIKEFSKVRLLSPVHKGEFSVEYFNQKIEAFLKNKGFLFPQFGFYHNQAIMITQNDYHLKLFNGDIGLIREDDKGVLQAYFEAEDGTLRSISPNFINQYKTVFAMTIHKSQGSEFEHVAVVLPQQEDIKILSKELLYTGLTRAKKNLWIFAKASTLEKVSQKPVQRASGITERLNDKSIPV